ncbi:hypothetical protein EVAR_65500_1 [Eumeta japonica]|uniref:Uncharacterized protein n=1 Tax=Eumeta variegata TaxID=151549 RepID=A0A4C2A9G3_EUMVA|nr:hypothetical protein EVAR_65500_1 [Eumeta japonica]
MSLKQERYAKIVPVKKRLDSSTGGAAGSYQEQTEKIIVLSDLAILAPPRVYALCLSTGGTALFTALRAGPFLCYSRVTYSMEGSKATPPGVRVLARRRRPRPRPRRPGKLCVTREGRQIATGRPRVTLRTGKAGEEITANINQASKSGPPDGLPT